MPVAERFNTVAPLQKICVALPVGAAGAELIAMVNELPALEQLPLKTFRVPVYVPAATPAATGRGNEFGAAGNDVEVTSTSPAVWAAAFHVMV